MGVSTCRQLKAARALAGWTQKDLGLAIGVDQRQIRFWEKRIPANTWKRQMLNHAFDAAGIEFITAPTIGVRLKGS